MGWSYNPALPDTRDKVRFAIGDTDSRDPLMADETLDALLDGEPDYLRVAVMACRALAAQYSRLADISGGEDSASLSQLQAQYTARATELEDFAETGVTGGSAAPAFLGGVTISGLVAAQTDTDRLPPYFERYAGITDRSLYP